MIEISFIAAFIAGVLTFFATCLIPVLPAYIGYLGGTSVKAGDQKDVSFYKRQVFINSLLFSLGFLTIFIILGFAATTVGNVFAANRAIFEKLGGIFLILMGIYMLEIIKLSSLFKTFQFQPSQKLRATKLGALLFGLSFGFAWTPCIGPVLATILFFAAQAETHMAGVFLLFTFGLGLAIPFVIVGALFQTVQNKIANLGKYASVIRILSGCIIIVAGVLLLTGQLGLISHWALEIGTSPALDFVGF